MKKRILASLMSLCLLVGLLPTAAFAAEVPSAGQDEQPVVCTCEIPCTEESRDETCPVCTEDYVLCEAQAESTTTETESDPDAQPGSEDGSEPTAPVCAELEGCVDGSHDPECPLYVAPAEPDAKPEEVPGPASDGEGGIMPSSQTPILSGYCGGDTSSEEYAYSFTGVAETHNSATAYQNIAWSLEPNESDDADVTTYTLKLTGSGPMLDFEYQWFTDKQGAETNIPWWDLRAQITQVDIADKITTIGAFAFYNNSFKTIVIPDSVTSIGENAVSDAKSLTSAVIGSGVATIKSHAFVGDSALTTLDIKDGSTALTLELCAFKETAIKNLTIPSRVISMAYGTFENCTALETVTFGENTNLTLALAVFTGCTNLKSVDMSSVNATLDGSSGAFKSCTALATIKLPTGSSFTTLPEMFCQGCTSLKSVIIPANVTGWKAGVFAGSGVETLVFETSDMGTESDCGVNYVNNTTADKVVIYTQNPGDTAWNKTGRGKSGLYGKEKQISAVTNGGYFPANTEFTVGTLAIPVKDGSKFEGWYEVTDEANWTLAETPTTEDFAVDTIYCAKWSGMDDMKLQYGGTQQITVSGVTLSGYASSDPSVATVDSTGKVTATGVGTATISATGTYNGQSTTFKATVTVTPRVLSATYTEAGSGSITYNYTGDAPALSTHMTFAWNDEPKTAVTLDEGTQVNYTYTLDTASGGSGEPETYDELPTNVGQYSVTLNLIDPNYTFNLTGGDSGTSNKLSITVNVQAEGKTRAYLASAAPKGEGFTYNGAGVMPVEGVLQAYAEDSTTSATVEIGQFTISIRGMNDTVFEESSVTVDAGTDLSSLTGLTLPMKPGQYQITASASNDSYYLYKTLVFAIDKATVTIRPDDKTAYVGDEIPDLGAEDYTVTGLVGSDTLTTAPTLSYEGTPDMSTTGTYTIKASGAAANDELYKLAYEDGTLTVSRRSSGGGSSSTRYTISTPSDADNGSIKVSPSRASKGSTVTITVKPDEGYVLDELIVTDKNGDTVKLTDKGNGKYTFKMPGSKVEIEASFVPQADPDIGLPFVDVASGSWYEDAVWYVYENGLMAGTSDTTFAPDVTTSRGMIVTILYRLEGTPAVSGASGFTDVADGQYYADAVAWAAANNIVGGYGNGLFGPNDTITREQMAAILYRYAQYKGYDVTASADLSGYSDVAQVSSYALAALQWANTEGLVNGTSDTTLTPSGSATRAQVAVILMRFCENTAE